MRPNKIEKEWRNDGTRTPGPDRVFWPSYSRPRESVLPLAASTDPDRKEVPDHKIEADESLTVLLRALEGAPHADDLRGLEDLGRSLGVGVRAHRMNAILSRASRYFLDVGFYPGEGF